MVHAAVEHTFHYPDEVWGAPTVVVLGVKDERRLEALSEELPKPVSIFREPDLGGELTALAVISPRGNPHLRRLTPYTSEGR